MGSCLKSTRRLEECCGGMIVAWDSFSESSGFICKQMAVTFADSPRTTKKPAKVQGEEEKISERLSSSRMARKSPLRDFQV